MTVLQEWYEEHWDDAEDVTLDMLRVIERHIQNYSPFDVYAHSLRELFRDREYSASEWEQSESAIFRELDSYQREGYGRMLEIADSFGGAFLCDGVGLGKTFVGLMLLERLVKHEKKNVVLLVPKSARDSVWVSNLRRFMPDLADGVFSGLVILNHTDLNRPGMDRQLAQISERADAIIIDEAHNFRNAVQTIEQNIAAAPLANFDLARQVRVYNARLQYVEVGLNNAAIERQRIAIPSCIQELGGGEELEGRLKTTFDLIEKNSSLSSKPLADKVAKLRKDFTPSLGKKFGRAIMKSAKPHFEKRLDQLRAELVVHQAKVAAELQAELDKSRKAIADHYSPLARANPPDAAVGLFGGDVEAWLDDELGQVFPLAEELIKKMALELDYKDVTFETLKEKDFLAAVRAAFPTGDWDKAHDEFKAAGEMPSAKSK